MKWLPCLLLGMLCAAKAETGAPYLTGTGAALPLLLTEVEVQIDGIIADVAITQHFTNTGTEPVEAVYVFPGSTRAAVYGVEMTVGDRRLVGKVREKQQARAEYEQARAEGRTTSLLEQVDPQYFSMRVGNILPGDDVRVRLQYIEELVPRSGTYRFVLPGRRAGSVLEPGIGPSGAQLAHGSTTGFDLSLVLRSPVPVAQLHSPSHEIESYGTGPDEITVALAADELFADRRDFILEYRLAGDGIETGLLVHEGDDADYFLLLGQAPPAVPRALVPPREYVFVVDVSGSMAGFPLETTRHLVTGMLDRLRPADRFNIVLFAGASDALYAQPMPAVDGALQRAVEFLGRRAAGGGTQLLPALHRAMGSPSAAGTSRSIIVVTDGAIYVPDVTLRYVRDHLHDANLFVFGIGDQVDHAVIERLSAVGRGEPFIVTEAAEAEKTLEWTWRYIESPVLTDIAIDVLGAEVDSVLPEGLSDLFADRPVFAVGRVASAAAGEVIVTGRSGQGPYQARYDLAAAPRASRAVAYLWAREQLRQLELEDAGEERRQAIVDIGLRYNLLTPHTSFVAVDDRVRTNQPGSRSVDVNRGSLGFGFALAPVHVGSAIGTTAPASATIVKPLAAPDVARPSVTLIAGDEATGSRYLTGARRLFREHDTLATELVLEDVPSLTAVRELLVEQHPGGRPWGVVNLVVHGSPWTGLRLPLADQDEPLNVDQLRGGVALPDGIIDGATQIRIYSCGIGTQVALLDAIARWFANASGAMPVVLSPLTQMHFLQTSAGIEAATVQHPHRVYEHRPAASDLAQHFGTAGSGQIRLDRIQVIDETLQLRPSRFDPAVLARGNPGIVQRLARMNLSPTQLAWTIEGGALTGRGWLAQGPPDPATWQPITHESIRTSWARAGGRNP